MTPASLVFSAPHWLWPAIAGVALAVGLLAWSYRPVPGGSLRGLCAGLKLAGVLALAACLLDPLWSGQRARPGANLLAVVADNSQGLQIKDQGESKSRGERLRELLAADNAGWQAALDEHFEVRRFHFDNRLTATRDFGELDFQGRSTALAGALRSLQERFAGRPFAGVLLFTDGNATDWGSTPPDLSGLPPVYPVVVGRPGAARDAALAQTRVTQTAFEDAPVTVQADVAATGLAGESLVAELQDAAGHKLQEATLRVRKPEESLAFRFQFRPAQPGLSFYRVNVAVRGENNGGTNAAAASTEATLLNNSRLVAVDRGRGPHRILYVAGRPNWEYKFLNRAVAEDDQVQLVALIRIALREPKFDFRGRGGETGNPLFRGFGDQSREEVERYDQPVILRLNTRDEQELRAGFPATPEDLFGYEAVVLDDVEAGFFTPDQAALLQRFVSERGGGLLMLGGMESFREGGYARTPIGDLLPVYLDRPNSAAAHPESIRLDLAREGWLQAWARLRDNEAAEKSRLESMPAFEVLNLAADIKPGASVVATGADTRGQEYPALVTQRFGRGRSAALLVGDVWRWGMQNPDARKDMEKSWRQLLRWLVADVPRPVELVVDESPGETPGSVRLQTRVRDARFQPVDDASVTLEVQTAAGSGTNAPGTVKLRAEASAAEPGLYEALFLPRDTGAYRATATVTNAVGVALGRDEAGWSTDRAAEEFRSLQPNLALLEGLARQTGGEVIAAEALDAFARRLPARKAPVMEAWTTPAWHTPALFAFALGCFVGEWGLRRWKGLP